MCVLAKKMRDSGLIMHKIPTLMHRNLMHLLAEAFAGAKRVVNTEVLYIRVPIE